VTETDSLALGSTLLEAGRLMCKTKQQNKEKHQFPHELDTTRDRLLGSV
jgi:hypothetical protein